MPSFEAPKFHYEKNHETLPESIEDGVDFRNENEIFRDHERLELNDSEDQSKILDDDQLAEEKDGVLHVPIPVYQYDTKYNPFLGMGPRTIRLYSVSRHLDVMFLHRFMYGNILVRGLRSGEYVPTHKRPKFIKQIQQTGGLPSIKVVDADDIFEALRFSPYVASDSTMPVFEYYHKGDLHAGDRPHHPVDIWLVHDINAYEQLAVEDKGKIAKYRFKTDYDRRSSLLALAVIN